MVSTLRKGLVVLCLSASTLVIAAGLASASISAISDPLGDTITPRSASQRQEATVDIKRVTYAVRNDNLIITTRVDDLARTKGNQFMETEVSTDEGSFTLVSEVGQSTVKVFTGSNLYACKGSSTIARFADDRDLVRQVVPVRCLDASEARFRSSAVLTKPNAAPITRDAARRSKAINL